ncbi:MAG: hypothetical protein CME62_15135 [Halobacteriovoraceae bacterium]|nr:hypothetical protein [Halobacteriovoraceae bacterium]
MKSLNKTHLKEQRDLSLGSDLINKTFFIFIFILSTLNHSYAQKSKFFFFSCELFSIDHDSKKKLERFTFPVPSKRSKDIVVDRSRRFLKRKLILHKDNQMTLELKSKRNKTLLHTKFLLPLGRIQKGQEFQKNDLSLKSKKKKKLQLICK